MLVHELLPETTCVITSMHFCMPLKIVLVLTLKFLLMRCISQSLYFVYFNINSVLCLSGKSRIEPL